MKKLNLLNIFLVACLFLSGCMSTKEIKEDKDFSEIRATMIFDNKLKGYNIIDMEKLNDGTRKFVRVKVTVVGNLLYEKQEDGSWKEINYREGAFYDSGE